MYSINGKQAEQMFDIFLRQQQATFKPALDPDVDLIIKIAANYSKVKLNTLLGYVGTMDSLKENGPRFCMDHLFKSDFFVTYEDANGKEVTLSIDVTSNYDWVADKEKEIISKEKALKRLGIDRALVIYWTQKEFKANDFKLGYAIAGEIISQLDANDRFLNTVVV